MQERNGNRNKMEQSENETMNDENRKKLNKNITGTVLMKKNVKMEHGFKNNSWNTREMKQKIP